MFAVEQNFGIFVGLSVNSIIFIPTKRTYYVKDHFDNFSMNYFSSTFIVGNFSLALRETNLLIDEKKPKKKAMGFLYVNL